MTKAVEPNAETKEAMQAARRGELSSFKSIDALFADLNAVDQAEQEPDDLRRKADPLRP